MKNFIISILATYIISGMSFWEYADADDRYLISFAMVFVIFIMIEAFDEMLTNWRRRRRFQKRMAERFKLEVIDLTKDKEAM